MIFNNPSQSRESILIVEWDKHSLSFSVFHEPTNRVLATKVIDVNFDLYQSSKQEIDKFLKSNDIFAYNFLKVIVVVNSPFYTLAPKNIEDINALEQILKLNVNVPSGILKYKKEVLKSTAYNVVFAYPTYLENTFTELFSNIEIVHINAVLIDMLTSYSKANSIFNAHLSLNKLDISLWSENALKFHNTFEIATAEDVVYYTLNVMQELNLNTERTQVYYSGAFEAGGEKIELLSNYIKFLNPLERTNKINYSSHVEAMPAHYFVHHYNLYI